MEGSKYYLKTWGLGLFLIFLCGLLNAQMPAVYSNPNSKAIKLFEESQKYVNTDPRKTITCLQKSIQKDSNFIESHLFLAEMYGYDGQYEKAVVEYNKAFLLNPGMSQANYFYAAQLELRLGHYDDAKAHADKYLASKSVSHKEDDEAQLISKSCVFAKEAMKHPVPFNPVNIGPEINTENDEYFATITADDQTFLFTRRLPVQHEGSQNKSFQEDFFYSNKENGKWTEARGIGPTINTEGNEGAPCLSADGQYLFFVACQEMYGYGLDRQGYGSCDIFISRNTGNGWSKPHNLGPSVNTKNWESQPSFSSDGKTLYFIRGLITAEGHGPGDIYMSQISEEGKWSTPVRLSNRINTPYREESVFIHPDNQTLYFASDGHVGMGGMDIYMSKRDANGEWGEPVNLGYPINTFNKENTILVDSKGKLAYFASNRPGGYGGLDIYSFDVDKNFKPENVTYFKGKVYDSRTKKPLTASFQLIDLESNKLVMESESNQGTGGFLLCLPTEKNYALNVSKPGYLFYSENFSLKESKDSTKPFLMDVPLQPIDTGLTVKLNNVFFETGKFDLKDESKTELQKLIAFLNVNKSLKIELGGHTDNTGDKKANVLLSQNRAKSVYEFLVNNGIPAERLSYKGYGDSKPVAVNDTPEHKQMNRRTEFKVIAK